MLLPQFADTTMAFNFTSSPSSSLFHDTHSLSSSRTISPNCSAQLNPHSAPIFRITVVSLQLPFRRETQKPSTSKPPDLGHPDGGTISSPSRMPKNGNYIKLIAPSSRPATQDQVSDESQKRNGSRQPRTGNPNAISSKRSVWQNPKSRRAVQIRKESYEVRYNALIKIAEYLNLPKSKYKEVSTVLLDLKDKIVEQDAVIILNHLTKPDTAVLALRFFQKNLKMSREVIFYNVTMKVCKKGRDLGRAEKLFDEMLERGVKPDNITFSTMISCAGMCHKPEKAVKWFEEMPAFGCDPDHVTYSSMIDACGKSAMFDKALSLYDYVRTAKLHIDTVAFSMVIKIHGLVRKFDECLKVYEEMKAVGTKPNLVIYNTLLDAMGRAKMPAQAKTIFKEMTDDGFLPNQATYAALIRVYGSFQYGQDALIVYREMKQKGIPLNMHLYNTLLSMCSDLGYSNEAAEIFEDMKKSGICKPDRWTYSCMITLYAYSGRISEANLLLYQMLGEGVVPSYFVLTSIIQGLGKANRTDDVVCTFGRITELGIPIDDRFCGCLLNVLSHTPREGLAKLTAFAEKVNSKLGFIINLLLEKLEDSEGQFEESVSELLNPIGADLKKRYCNCLIDICVNLNLLKRASELFNLGRKLGVYKRLQLKSPKGWYLYIKTLSIGAALTAIHVWIDDLSRTLESGEELPPLLGICVGSLKRRYGEKELFSVVKLFLTDLNAPFREARKIPWFLTSNLKAKLWLKSRRNLHELVAA